MAFAFTGCGEKADYESPQVMYDAHLAGENVIGKTVDVMATYDYTEGQIFDGPAHNLGPTIYIQLTGDGAEKVKKGNDIIVKIKEIEYESRFSVSFICEKAD